MSIDLAKLTPLPLRFQPADGKEWTTPCVVDAQDFPVLLSELDNEDDLKFAVLARNAFAGDKKALAWWEANRVRLAEQEKANG